MNLYFVKVIGTAFADYVVLAPNKNTAEDCLLKRLGGKGLIDRSKTRLVPDGHFIVGDTFMNSES